MTQKDKIVAGLDIGTTKVCAVVGKLNQYGKLDVIGFTKTPSEGVREGTVLNIQKTSESITKIVKTLEDKYNIIINTVNIGVAGKNISCFQRTHGIALKSVDSQISMQDISRLTSDMFSTVVEPGSKIIHVLPRNFTIDYGTVVKDPIGISGSRLEAEFNVITANITNINNIKRSVEMSSLKINDLILEPLASSLAVLNEEEKESGVVLVDIGGGTTDIAIFQDGIIRHTAVLPFGGNIITNDIKDGCDVMQQQAELLKVKHGRAMEITAPYEIISINGTKDRPGKEISSRSLAAIIEARMMEIIKFIYGEIQKAESKNSRIKNIVLTGGGAKLKDITHIFEHITHMDTRVGYPNEHLGTSVVEDVKEPMCATAVGLVLSGFISFDERQNTWNETQKQTQVGYSPSSHDDKKGKKWNIFNAIRNEIRNLITDDFRGKDEFK
jgi:cell division protein FtsA